MQNWRDGQVGIGYLMPQVADGQVHHRLKKTKKIIFIFIKILQLLAKLLELLQNWC